MSPAEIQSWIGLAGLVFGAGIGYQALNGRIKSLEDRTAKIESNVADFEKENAKKLDVVISTMNDLKTAMARVEERIHKSL